ncbi:hypothetical protein DFJ77DRAFT_455000 [Powellomyces hirtus]|nr:hypothetical protein DFJ77DRAFT_455000 [Powellomyces hirtus]
MYWSKALASLFLAAAVLKIVVPPTSIKDSTTGPQHQDRFLRFIATESGVKAMIAVAGVFLPVASLRYIFFSQHAREAWSFVDVVALLVGAGGLLLRVAAFRELDRFFTYKLTIQEGGALTSTSSHPSYTGIAMMAVGYVRFHRHLETHPFLLVLGAAGGLAVLIARILDEETLLQAHFGDEWVRHTQGRARLLPLVW